VYVIAGVLVLLSVTTEEANIAAAIGGALTGVLLGLILPRLVRS
jgi:membrane associated rhomboid family serine protease